MLREIMEGRASEAQAAAFLIALRTKGETVDEIVGLAQTMRALAKRVDVRRRATTCSTPPARAAGARRSTCRPPPRSSPPARAARWPSTATARATGKSGSADLLEALGAADRPRARRRRRLHPHGRLRLHVRARTTTWRCATSCPVRKELAVRTIFNFLGPLTNPAGAERQVIGVSEPRLPRDDRGRSRRARRSARVGSFQRRWARRDQRLRRDPLRRAEGRGDRQLHRHARGAGGRARARRTRSASARPDENARDRPRRAGRRGRAPSAS